MLWLVARSLASVQPAGELPDLAVNDIPKRSGVRRHDREKLHCDVEHSGARDRLTARHLHRIVVVVAAKIDSKTGNRSDLERAGTFDETAGRASIQHPNRQLGCQCSELFASGPHAIVAGRD